MSLPVHVRGHDVSGAAWEEVTHSLDISRAGVAFRLERPVEVGQVLHLSLPLPKAFRTYDLTDTSYRVYALVRNVMSAKAARVGLVLLGKSPPRGYEEQPGGRYLLPSDQRRSPRYDIILNIKLRRLDTRGVGPQEELTVTENIGTGGAQVPTSMPVYKGDRVLIEEVKRAFSARAEVLNAYVGKDKVTRLNLKFVDEAAAEQMSEVLRRFGVGDVGDPGAA